MYPDERVLVGVINRKRDIDYLLKEQWYRVPQTQMPHGIYAEYIACYVSGYPARKLGGSGIYYFARRTGVELVYRRDLLPQETDHKNADATYYKIQLDAVQYRVPPITNPNKRSISFIMTTWDRFVAAKTINDLYSKADYYVDRIYHALRDRRIRPDRYWEVLKPETGYGAGFRIVCDQGTINAYTDGGNSDGHSIKLDVNRPEDEILREIEMKIASMGGVVTLPIPPT